MAKYLDRNGVELRVGQRVRFNANTHYVNTREGTGVVRVFSPYHYVEIDSDEPIPMGSPSKPTQNIGIPTNYNHQRKAMVAEHVLYLDGFPADSAWVEVIARRGRKR